MIGPIADIARSAISSRETLDYSEYLCTGGGTAVVEFDENSIDGQGNIIYPYEMTITYNNCVYVSGADSLTYDGTLYFSGTSEDVFTYVGNLSVTYVLNGETYSYSFTGTYSCDFTVSYYCSYSTDYQVGGVAYRTADVSVDGDNINGFNVTATIYHETMGYIEVYATGLVMCENGGFSAGTVEVTDSTEEVVLEVTFYDDCSTMLVSFGSSSEEVSY